jgi:hypothetical protein
MDHRDRRRLVRGRLGMAVAAGMLMVVAVFALGRHVAEGLVAWLHGQPVYQTTFGAIVLDPPPPPWYRGGSAAFLSDVRKASQRSSEPFSALDLDLADLSRQFRLYCWVRRVLKVERHAPNRIRVQLEYRKPVARVAVAAKPGRILLDDEAVILPTEAVDEERVGSLIRLEGLDRPLEARVGAFWSSEETAERGTGADERTLAAVRLAGWLETALACEPKPLRPALRPIVLYCSNLKNAFFLETAEKTLIYWPPPPPFENPVNHSAEQRWAAFHKWIKQRPPTAPPLLRPFYLDFTGDGVVVRHEESSAG